MSESYHVALVGMVLAGAAYAIIEAINALKLG